MKRCFYLLVLLIVITLKRLHPHLPPIISISPLFQTIYFRFQHFHCCVFIAVFGLGINTY